jgi:hypothetical protein
MEATIEKVDGKYTLVVGNAGIETFASADAALDAALDLGLNVDEIVTLN